MYLYSLLVYGYWQITHVQYKTQHNSSFPIHADFCHFCVVVVKKKDMKIFKPLIHATLTLQRTKQPWASKRFDSAASIQCIQSECLKRSLMMGMDPSGQNADISL